MCKEDRHKLWLGLSFMCKADVVVLFGFWGRGGVVGGGGGLYGGGGGGAGGGGDVSSAAAACSWSGDVWQQHSCPCVLYATRAMLTTTSTLLCTDPRPTPGPFCSPNDTCGLCVTVIRSA